MQSLSNLTPGEAARLAHQAETPASPDAIDPSLLEEAIALVRTWLGQAGEIPPDASAALLAGLLKDPSGLGFTTRFIDGVIRPEDPAVAGGVLAEIAPLVPQFVPKHMRAAVKVGGALGRVAPDLVVPAARRVLREMVGHLVIDATERRLGPALARLRGDATTKLNINLLGEAVLGAKEADARLDGTIELLSRPDVDYVSIKVSAAVAPHAPWAFDATVAAVAERLVPLFRAAAPAGKFVNLDMEEYHDLELTVAVFKAILERPEFLGLEAGIVLQAYLPDALGAMADLQEWSSGRRARGGAPVKVRLVKGANLPMERVQASLHGWPLATCLTKVDTDANYLRVLDYALDPARVDAVRLGVAGHNLFDIAYAWLLAGRRQVRAAVEFEMLLGMAKGQVEAVKREVGAVRLYTPVVSPSQFDVAIAYLVRRLEEGADHANFMSAVFDLAESPELFERERQRFLASVAALDAAQPAPRRSADRFAAAGRPGPGHFAETPDTDPAVAANQAAATAILARARITELGLATTADAVVPGAEDLDRLVGEAAAAGAAWAARGGAERSAILHAAGEALEARRSDLLEIMAAEAGKTIDQGDPEVSEAVDFAHYYAEAALELENIEGAEFRPRRVTAVVPPWNFPCSIPAGGVLAALAAGSAVVFKPARLTARTGAVVAEALWRAGVPREVLRLVSLASGELGSRLIAHPQVDQVILTGSYETAELFRSLRPSLTLLAETSGKNAIIVTPSADMNLAAKDVAASAFGHAGQKCSAASLVILVGSAARSRRFRDQLIDAAQSLKVGPATDPTTMMGPVIEPPGAKLRRGLTELEPGQQWVLRPRQLDGDGRLWSPGIRAGVRPGSEFHLTEYFGPVLGVMRAETLEQAVAWANQVDYGLTSGLHSLDRAEIEYWLEHIHAGNIYVNRTITGAIVRRQPFGGWKRSAVGAGAKAGGPNYLIGLADWAPAAGKAGDADAAGKAGDAGNADAADAANSASPADPPAPLGAGVSVLVRAAEAGLEQDRAASLARAAASAAEAWSGHFAPRDVTGLTAEHNVLRYRPFLRAVQVRLAPGGDPAALAKVLVAGLTAGGEWVASSADPLPAWLDGALAAIGRSVVVEDDATFAARLAAGPGGRVRLVGGAGGELLDGIGGRPDVAVYANPPTESGRLEILPFVVEQAVAVTAHRFGMPDPMVRDLRGL
ncbi:MAG: bifunctional proline dehydrogenase/L-glutamate gamma-semialdehyde dehydrogenase [Bifidobacteriaceae bacterium]|jgi:RHH-type proline utilization regulon transcriptional repressor/proline dehydrogenase/delta 1-pyrroline-5-carboxylate dehydrogenase|nr:bifunctional proline dehydrogenase/L-glutamate gamma-semialdehyde dehydrogenase [Bifidobacteriaceae bacterium]